MNLESFVLNGFITMGNQFILFYYKVAESVGHELLQFACWGMNIRLITITEAMLLFD